jgi:hypothetical protein
MSRSLNPPTNASENPPIKRRSTVERIATAQVASMGSTLADTIGESARQRLVWLGLLAMPLLFPVALPGMGTTVGVLCMLVAFGLCTGQSVPLPRWLAKRELNARVQTLLASMVSRAVNLIGPVSRPRMLPLSNRPVRMFNGLMLTAAGLSMAVPVPIVSFDNVLPALAIVLISWGLRLRDGVMLLAGYLATIAAVASVMLLWWGGSALATELSTMLWP